LNELQGSGMYFHVFTWSMWWIIRTNKIQAKVELQIKWKLSISFDNFWVNYEQLKSTDLSGIICTIYHHS
jgi:hypothetical protein